MIEGAVLLHGNIVPSQQKHYRSALSTFRPTDVFGVVGYLGCAHCTGAQTENNPHMKFRMILLLIAFGLVTAGCENRAEIVKTAKPRYEPLDRCFAEQHTDLKLDVEPECGYVTVPATRNAKGGPGGPALQLGVMRLKSKQSTT